MTVDAAKIPGAVIPCGRGIRKRSATIPHRYGIQSLSLIEPSQSNKKQKTLDSRLKTCGNDGASRRAGVTAGAAATFVAAIAAAIKTAARLKPPFAVQQAGGVEAGIIGGEIQVEGEVAGGFADGESRALLIRGLALDVAAAGEAH